MWSPLGAGHQPRWVALVQFIAVGTGLALGALARPDALPVLAVAALLQCGVSLLGWRGLGGPLAYVAAVSVVVLAAVIDPVLRELLYLGGVPYVHLGMALATYSLIRRATAPSQLSVGAALLVTSALLVALASTGQGAPLAMALLASTVPVLVGALVATSSQLRLARQDRLERSWATGSAQPAGAAPGSTQSSDAAPESTQRAGAAAALAQVLLLTEAQNTSTEARTAAWAEELRRIAWRGLRAETGMDRVHLELRVDDSSREHPENSSPEDPGGAPLGLGEAPPGPGDAPPGPGTDPSAPELSDRERELAHLLTAGASNAQIARELYLSEATIKGHVSRMMRRFDCDNRTQLALLATRWSL